MTAHWWGSASLLPGCGPAAVLLVPLGWPKGPEGWGGAGLPLRAAFPCCLLAWPVLCGCVGPLLGAAMGACVLPAAEGALAAGRAGREGFRRTGRLDPRPCASATFTYITYMCHTLILAIWHECSVDDALMLYRSARGWGSQQG